MVKAYFTQIESVIKEEIKLANNSLKIALAWFTNRNLFNVLLKKLEEGVTIELVLRDDYINNSNSSTALQWIEFLNKGGKFYFSDASQMMHHKYCIIDEQIVITGSYNWTYQAEQINQENIIIAHDSSLVDSFINNFNTLREKSYKVNYNSKLNHRSYFEAPKAEIEFAEVEQQLTNSTIGNIDQLLIEADSHYANKRYEKAIAVLNSIVSMGGSESIIYEIFAKVRLRQDDYDECLKLAEHGLRLDKNNPELHNVLGLAYRSLRNQSKTLEAFDAAINLMPKNPDYYFNKIVSLDNFGIHSQVAKERYKVMQVASDIIKNKAQHSPVNVMKAHICMGLVKDSRSEREKSGLKAKAIFDSLPKDEKDLHDLDDINTLLTN